MGKAITDGIGLGQLQALVEIAGVGLGLFARHDIVADCCLNGLINNMVRRIKRSSGTLGHIGNTRAPQGAALFLGSRY
jgi:hypothetical protein